MKTHFYKYQGAGNDFVLIDNRSGRISLSTEQIKKVCDRRFGVGADGLILIGSDQRTDFEMVYYNSDGSQSLCANGCRTAVHLASRLGMINGKTTFKAYDGAHQAALLGNGRIRLQMSDVSTWEKVGDDYFINTGSPHYIRFVVDLKDFPVVEEGRKIRYSDKYAPGGTNANFVELKQYNVIAIRTYERGVEDETLACGTGVTAAALAAHFHGFESPVSVLAQGGELQVEFSAAPLGRESGQAVSFTEIYLTGPANLVFEGDLEL